MEVFTKQEVAEKLRTSQRTIERCIQNGTLAVCKINRLVRITQEQLDDFINKSRIDNGNPGLVIS